MQEPGTLTIYGTAPSVTDQEVFEGWNLVAYPAGSARSVSEALSSISGQYTAVWGHEPGATGFWQHYRVDIPAWANTLTQFTPGQSYWVVATEACTLRIAY